MHHLRAGVTACRLQSLDSALLQQAWLATLGPLSSAQLSSVASALSSHSCSAFRYPSCYHHRRRHERVAVNHSALGTTAPSHRNVASRFRSLLLAQLPLRAHLPHPRVLSLPQPLPRLSRHSSCNKAIPPAQHGSPKESGEMGLVQVPVDGDSWQTAHEELFRIGKKPKEVKTDTPSLML